VTKNHIALPATNDNQEWTLGQREQDNIVYDNLAKTANFPIANGFVSFTRTFRYSTTVSATTMTSRQELLQPLQQWVHQRKYGTILTSISTINICSSEPFQ
jgi:hypothetical protein